ncbi:YgjP-like metallopeptidase domain-containing protein [Aquipuribacter sp. SD81]|uniref:YgjP-like metallopeptidase domain-containing protein n=1 Tax=Aquipuribacter sp. SD81 TaxID=3127703 RepID=UPI00301852AE
MVGAGDEPGSRPDAPVVEVRRSHRRRRTVSAHREGDRVVVLVPARLSAAEERRWVDRMVTRLGASERRRRPSDSELVVRAAELSRRYLEGRALPTSVRWSGRQGQRWGSCTPSDGTIRISERAKGLPAWVLDYVLLHELAHLLEPSHGPGFWQLLAPYPRTERARGFLEGYDTALRDGGAADGADQDDADQDDADQDDADQDDADQDDADPERDGTD